MKTATQPAFTPSHLHLWERPGSYYGATWEGYFVFLGQNRESCSLTRSNFQCALAAIGGETAAIETEDGEEIYPVTVVREGHWACGWIEWIAIHESNAAALEIADRIAEKLDSYPVVNEDHFSELEDSEAQSVWKDCYNEAERIRYMRENSSQFDFRDFADVRAQVRGEYFSGYASELLA